MIALSGTYWVVIATVAAILYVVTCARTARRMGQTGRNAIVWFFITVFFTSLPAAIVMLTHQRHIADRCQGQPPKQCRHCGALLPAVDAPDDGTCPSCGMMLDQEHLA